MKNKRKILYSLTLGAALLAGHTTASQAAVGFYITPSGGYYMFDHDDDNNLDDAGFYGLSLGIQFSKYFAIEAGYFEMDNPETNSLQYDVDGILRGSGSGLNSTGNFNPIEVDANFYRIEGVFNLDFFNAISNTVVPYISLGYARLEQDPQFSVGAIQPVIPPRVSGGVVDQNVVSRGRYPGWTPPKPDDKEDMMTLGVGLKYKVTPAFSVNADIRGLHDFDNDDTDYAAGLGVSYLFGVQQEALPPVVTPPPRELPGDADGDGVLDPDDECPNTPAGVQVDRRGCPIDSDGDGVPDYLDKCPGTPPGARVDEDGCARIAACETVNIKMDIKFDFDKSVVKPAFYPELQKVGDFMRNYPYARAVVEGHTDSVGSDAYNQKLSERRVNAVREALISRFGISADRLTAIGYGEARPIASNATDAGRQENRRVVAVLSEQVGENCPK